VEFVKAFDIPNADIIAAGVGSTIEKEIAIPAGASRWTIHIVPKTIGAGPFNDPTFNLQYHVGNGEFFDTNPATSNPALVNKTNVITREDMVSRIKVQMTNPPTNLQDGDTLVRLFMDRSGG